MWCIYARIYFTGSCDKVRGVLRKEIRRRQKRFGLQDYYYYRIKGLQLKIMQHKPLHVVKHIITNNEVLSFITIESDSYYQNQIKIT